MTDIDNRPELPDVFPQTDVTVTGETHRYKVSQTDSGPEPKLDYVLDKAPVDEVQSIQGTDQNGTSRTFSNGVDYELTALDDTVSDQFEYEPEQQYYLLRYDPLQGSTTVTDSDGTTYIEGSDYLIVESDEHYGDSLEWKDGGARPSDDQLFTVEYDISIKNCVISWQTDGANLPQAGSEFYVTYRAESVISRYLDAHESELEKAEQQFHEIISNKFVDKASGEALDELGKLFGPIIGKRRGRNDTQYRIYLKSVVQSFISRGTVEGIKLAISAATEVPIDDITINEDFENVEYEVQVNPDTPVTVELLENVAEIADPSGVNQVRTRFVIDPDEVQSNDKISIIGGIQVPDTFGAADTTANFGFGTEGAVFDDLLSEDSTRVDPNLFDAGIDQISANDSNAIDTNKSSSSDNLSVDDGTLISRAFSDEDVTLGETFNVESLNKNAHKWEDTDDPAVETEWDFFEWTELRDLDQSTVDTAFLDDAVDIIFNETSTTDTAVADDAVQIPPTDANTADTSGSDDGVANVSQELVAWDTRDWNTLEWTVEHN